MEKQLTLKYKVFAIPIGLFIAALPVLVWILTQSNHLCCDWSGLSQLALFALPFAVSLVIISVLIVRTLQR